MYVYILVSFILSFFCTLFQGRHRTHTGYRGMPHLHCFLHSTVGWLAGKMSSRQCCRRWVDHVLHTQTHTHRSSITLCITHSNTPIYTVHKQPASPSHTAWMASRSGVKGLIRQASNGIIKAVQQGSVAHAEMGIFGGDGWGDLGRERSKLGGGGCLGSEWKVCGLAQGCRQSHDGTEGGSETGGGGRRKGKESKARKVGVNFVTITFDSFFFNQIFFLFYEFFCLFFFFISSFLQMAEWHNLGSE